MVKSIGEFDQLEVRSVVDTLLSPARREQCFIGIYRRSVANIATLLELESAKHFQTIVMLTRSLFELAVDIRLISVISDSCRCGKAEDGAESAQFQSRSPEHP